MNNRFPTLHVTPLVVILCAVAVVIMPCANLRAQETNATITGTVTDGSGAELPGVTVTVTNIETSISQDTTTDSHGAYTVPKLRPGKYRVTAALQAFKTYVRDGIVLHTAETGTINVTLTLGALAETITVNGAVSSVESNQSTLAQTMENKRVSELPLNGRQVYMLLQLTAGTVFTQTQFGAQGFSGTRASEASVVPSLSPIDRTAKLFIGGKQARPDSGYSRAVLSPSGAVLGQVGDGNRKDIRNAVEAASKAESWASTSGHARAQILYYCAENLSARADEFARRLRRMTGASAAAASREVEASIRRLFTYAAWADKFDGAVHDPPLRGVVLAMHEAQGVIGIACPDEAPLLAFISLLAPAVAMGNRVVIVPSEKHPLAATDFYQVLETSDVPAGVVNIVTGPRDALALVLAEHGNVEAVWYFGPRDGVAKIEKASAADLKRTWSGDIHPVPWHDATEGEGRHFLRQATQVKNIWIPYGA